jgi:hypothetical protein
MLKVLVLVLVLVLVPHSSRNVPSISQLNACLNIHAGCCCPARPLLFVTSPAP